LRPSRVQLADRVKVIEDLQHRVQVQREAAVLLAQRIEVLSTKPWRDAQAVWDALRADVEHWQAQAAASLQDMPTGPAWMQVSRRSWKPRAPSCWSCGMPFRALWRRPVPPPKTPPALPPVPVWADELRVARGVAGGGCRHALKRQKLTLKCGPGLKTRA
jgi:ATP-dependent RNA helicase SUPV3L1/SUV3